MEGPPASGIPPPPPPPLPPPLPPPIPDISALAIDTFPFSIVTFNSFAISPATSRTGLGVPGTPAETGLDIPFTKSATDEFVFLMPDLNNFIASLISWKFLVDFFSAF